MTIIGFISMILGGLNWLSIGLLQYDFIAGLFGTQANIFSRLIYICVGIGTAIVLYNLAKNKGKLILFNKHHLSRKNDEYYSKEQDNSRSNNPIERDILSD